MNQSTRNVDAAEIAKFSELAHRWWDPNSEFKPLHEINPLRLKETLSIRALIWVSTACAEAPSPTRALIR